MPEYRGIIYGYPRPDGKICYVGQARNLRARHLRHLKDILPIDKYLQTFSIPPEPIQLLEVVSPTNETLIEDLVFHETVLMFKYHTIRTWFPNDGGFNKCVPQSVDYTSLARLGGMIGGPAGGKKFHEMYPELAKENGRKFHNLYPELAIANGRKGGRKVMEAGIGIFGRTPEEHRATSQKSGRAAVLRKDGVHAPGVAAKGGRIGGKISGKIAVETGQLARLRTPEHQYKAGCISGQKNVENGHIFRMTHNRWHIQRNLFNPKCKLCVETKQSKT